MTKNLLSDLKTNMQEQLEEPMPPLVMQFSSSEEDENIDQDLYKRLAQIRSKNNIQELFSIQMPDQSQRQDFTIQQRAKIIDDWYWLITKQASILKQKQQDMEQFHIQTSISELEKPTKEVRSRVINETNRNDNSQAVGLSTLDKKTFITQYSIQQINPFFSQTIKQFDQQDLTSLLLFKPKYDDEMNIVVDPNQFNKKDLLEQPVIHQGYIKIEIDTSPFDYQSFNTDEIINFTSLKDIRDRFIFLANDGQTPQKLTNPKLQDFKENLKLQNAQQMELEIPKRFIELNIQIPSKIKPIENINQDKIQEEIQEEVQLEAYQEVQKGVQDEVQYEQNNQEPVDQGIIEEIEIQIQENIARFDQAIKDNLNPFTFQHLDNIIGEDQGEYEQESPQIEKNVQKIHIPINFNQCQHYDRNDLQICEVDDKSNILLHNSLIPCYQSDEEKYRSSSSSEEEDNNPKQDQIKQIQELIENFNPFEQLQNFNPDNISIKQFQELIYKYLNTIKKQFKFSELYQYFNQGQVKVSRGRILVALLFVLKSQGVLTEQINDQDFNIQIVY